MLANYFQSASRQYGSSNSTKQTYNTKTKINQYSSGFNNKQSRENKCSCDLLSITNELYDDEASMPLNELEEISIDLHRKSKKSDYKNASRLNSKEEGFPTSFSTSSRNNGINEEQGQ